MLSLSEGFDHCSMLSNTSEVMEICEKRFIESKYQNGLVHARAIMATMTTCPHPATVSLGPSVLLATAGNKYIRSGTNRGALRQA